MSSRMQASVSNKFLAVFAELRYYNRDNCKTIRKHYAWEIAQRRPGCFRT